MILKGYNDILELNTPVEVKRTGHVAKVSKLVPTPSGTCYHITPNDPDDLGGYWYLRSGLIKI